MPKNQEQQEIPIQPVDEPILCSPYAEPDAHWVYDKDTGRPSKLSGRRAAGYWVEQHATADEQLQFGLVQEEGWSTLQLVNALREDVRRWRASNYRNATHVTRQLLRYWQRENRQRPLFFCQLEAVETVIYLAEIRRPKHRVGFTPAFSDADFAQLRDGELIRYGCKMATGSGKTVVMAMLIAWTFCNRGKVRSDTRFPSAVLAICPNLTIKERLQVLRPDAPDNYYDAFDLVPPMFKAFLRRGKVKITNWHQLEKASEHAEGGTAHRVVQKGEETADAYAARILGELAGRGEIMVLNDEGHHAYRPFEPETTLDREESAERQTATVWIQGLDLIQQACGIRFAIDLSATPFYLRGSGHPEGKPFEWLVSDFGLGDAIESGITKIPRIPISDSTGRPEPHYFRLWEHITDKVGKQPTPEEIYRAANDALITLASQWKRQFDENPSKTPNCMIVVCPETKVAEEFHRRISGEQVIADENGKRVVYGLSDIFEALKNSEGDVKTFRIDSKRLTEEGADADSLRKVVSTIGKEGQPGEQIRCVVSVSMLNEGWDANNVTQIIGLRAFRSQLLCEQVVGRGLRRMSYDIDAQTGLLPAEYVDIYGIPFTLIPFKGKKKSDVRVDKPTTRVRALPERHQHEIRFPNVENCYPNLHHDAITADIANMEELRLEGAPEVFSGGITLSDGNPIYLGELLEQSRQAYYDANHFQTIQFDIVKRILERLPIAQWQEKPVLSRCQLFPQVYRLVDAYTRRKIKFGYTDKRELGNVKYKEQVVNLFLNAIHPNEKAGETTLLPSINPNKPSGSSADVDFSTTKDCRPTEKSHVNFVTMDSTWEGSAAVQLERSILVKSYVRNDGLGFTIPYYFQDASRDYVPDFIVVLTNGVKIIVEIKGRERLRDAAKHQAAQRWVKAVNHAKQYGTWKFHVCRNPNVLGSELKEYTA